MYVFKSKRWGGKYAVISVYQFIRDKEYYINLDWDENKKVPNRFLSEDELENYWHTVLERMPHKLN